MRGAGFSVEEGEEHRVDLYEGGDLILKLRSKLKIKIVGLLG